MTKTLSPDTRRALAADTLTADTLADTLAALTDDALAADALTDDVLAAEPLYADAETLRAAYVTCSIAGTVSAKATATLADITLARYSYYVATRPLFTGTLEGVPVVLGNMQGEISMLLWAEATGLLKAPTGKSRVGAATSFGQYISHYGKVATNGAYGIASLATVDIANKAYKAINASVTAAKAKAAIVAAASEADKESRAYREWLTTLPQSEQTKVSHVITLMQKGGAPHLPSFVAAIKFPVAAVDYAEES